MLFYLPTFDLLITENDSFLVGANYKEKETLVCTAYGIASLF